MLLYAQWGFPVDRKDLRLTVKSFWTRNGPKGGRTPVGVKPVAGMDVLITVLKVAGLTWHRLRGDLKRASLRMLERYRAPSA